MARLHRCWVIVDGAQPTAFHAKEAEQLVPTLKQLQRTQPQVVMMWFERGRMWSSPEAALQALREQRGRRSAPDRGRDWRPGGEHRDPKARPEIPRDVRRARFKKRLIDKKTGGAGRRENDSTERGTRPPSGREPRPRGTGRPGPPWRDASSEPSSGRGSSGGPSSRRPPSGAPRDQKGRDRWQPGHKPPDGRPAGGTGAGRSGGKDKPTFGRKPDRSHGSARPPAAGRNDGGDRRRPEGPRAPDRKRNRR